MTTVTWLAVTSKDENGKYYSYVIPIRSNENLLSTLELHKGIIHANAYRTKCDAASVVEQWNRDYINNGTSIFSEEGACRF